MLSRARAEGPVDLFELSLSDQRHCAVDYLDVCEEVGRTSRQWGDSAPSGVRSSVALRRKALGTAIALCPAASDNRPVGG